MNDWIKILGGMVLAVIGIALYMYGMVQAVQWMCMVGMALCAVAAGMICYAAYKRMKS